MCFITFFLAQTVDSTGFLYQMYPTKILLRILPIPILEYLSPTWMQWIGFAPFCWNCSLGHKNCFGNRPTPFAEISSNEPKINKNWGWVWKARLAVYLLHIIVSVWLLSFFNAMVSLKKQHCTHSKSLYFFDEMNDNLSKIKVSKKWF